MEDLIFALKNRLFSIGYTPTEDDYSTMVFASNKAKAHILLLTGQDVLPEKLFEICVDRACGEFLQSYYAMGKLCDTAVASLREGDTTVTFNEKDTPAERLKTLLAWFFRDIGGEIACYRKICW